MPKKVFLFIVGICFIIGICFICFTFSWESLKWFHPYGKYFIQTNSNKRGYIIGCPMKVWERFVLKELYYLFQRLITEYHWSLPSDEVIKLIFPLKSSDGTSIPENLIPDYVLFCEQGIKPLNAFNARALRQLKPSITVGYWCDELRHGCRFEPDKMVEILNNIDVFITPYAYQLFDTYRPLWSNAGILTAPDILWIPHSASLEYTNDSSLPFNANAKEEILLSGFISHLYYPLRHWLVQNKDKVGKIATKSHPGYYDQNVNQSLNYAHTLWSYQASFTCTSIYNYLVAKVFEIPASGSLLLVNSEANELMQALQLQPQVHFVNYSAVDPTPTLKWVLDPNNKPAVNKIRQMGMKTVRALHTTAQRSDAIQAYYERGEKVYEIPKHFQPAPCPNVVMPSLENCLQTFKRMSMYQ